MLGHYQLLGAMQVMQVELTPCECVAYCSVL
jgi:hypothetical protein